MSSDRHLGSKISKFPLFANHGLRWFDARVASCPRFNRVPRQPQAPIAHALPPCSAYYNGVDGIQLLPPNVTRISDGPTSRKCTIQGLGRCSWPVDSLQASYRRLSNQAFGCHPACVPAFSVSLWYLLLSNHNCHCLLDAPGCWLAIASTPEGAAAADVDELNVDKAMVDAAALALAWCTSCCSDAWLGMWPIRSDLWLWRRGSRVLEGVQGEVSLNSPSVTATASCEWHGMPEGLIKNTSALLAYKFSAAAAQARVQLSESIEVNVGKPRMLAASI
eukprot:366436-Chlamydomonas_euryale.AAC.1